MIAGDKLPSELELCKQFGVSRTVVREALKMLNAKGLVLIVKGKGVFVRDFSSDIVTNPLRLYLQVMNEENYVLDIVKTRQIIEPPIAALAAINRTEEDIIKIEKAFQELKNCQGDFSQLAKLDMTFHLEIAKASENTVIPLILEPIHKLMPEIKSSVYATNIDAKESALKWHRKILDRIIDKDSDGAFDAMSKHLKIAEEHARKMLMAQRILLEK